MLYSRDAIEPVQRPTILSQPLVTRLIGGQRRQRTGQSALWKCLEKISDTHRLNVLPQRVPFREKTWVRWGTPSPTRRNGLTGAGLWPFSGRCLYRLRLDHDG